MSSLPRAESAVNGIGDAAHTQQPAERPIMGSSEGAAELEAQATAENVILGLLSAADPKSALDKAAYGIGRLVGHGLLDRALWADLLRRAAIKVELLPDVGENGVQAAIAAGFTAGQHAAAEARAEEEEREKTDLDRMNERFAVVRVGGKTRVMEFQNSPARRDALIPVYSTFRDFKDFHDKWRVQVETDGAVVSMGLGTWWLKHPQRQQYDAVVFEPGASEEDTLGRLNLWRGFAVHPMAGDCSLYLAHLRDNICSANEEHAAYLLNWLAWGAQNPGDRAEVAVVLKGGEGTGKGVAINTYGELFGSHYVHISQPSHLTGHFNAHLQGCTILFADEALFAGDRRHDGTLKMLISESTIPIEPKGADTYHVRNCLHVLMASNSEWVIPAGADARRFFVLEVSDARRQDTGYFGAIARQMCEGGREALLHFLLNRDLSTFNIRAVPVTEALQDQKARSRRGVDLLVEMLAEEGRLPCTHSLYPNIALTSGEDLGEGFWARARVLVPGLKHESSRVIQRTLRRGWGCETWRAHGQTGLRFPPLAELRAQFDRRHGAQEWNEQEEWAGHVVGP